jgi:putative glycosyltransferase (TIGR04372 family)
LVERGVDPDRWFCVLHYREPNYGFRMENIERDFDPRQAIEIIRHVTRELGGQVLRIGHAGMMAFPEMPGFIDLSGEADGFALHAQAVSQARFFLELSPSGPMSLALLFGVPVARCNCVGIWGPVEEHSLVLPKHIRRPDGRFMSLVEMLDERVIHDTAMSRLLKDQGYSFTPNSVEELKAVADDMVETTDDCPGWRQPAEPTLNPPANSFQWPLPHSFKHRIANYPRLAHTLS